MSFESAVPPFSFAILRRDRMEIMLQRASPRPSDSCDPMRPRRGWAAYLRLEGGRLLALSEEVRRQTELLRGPERMPYGQVELEVSDPDGHRLCPAEPLDPAVPVPFARE